MTHWDHLSVYVPNIEHKNILDLGSGRGKFLIEAARRGARATGLELSGEYIAIARAAAQAAGVSIQVEQGRAEQMPFPDASFDFVNMGEVIEHVEDPEQMLKEVYRVLKPGGGAYLSVPNRFGMKDPHFHLYFVNWLPRAFSDFFIGLFGRHKKYEDTGIGRQRLADMHYYTLGGIRSLTKQIGFEPVDIRAERIHNEFTDGKRMLARTLYPLARTLYFDSLHLYLKK